MRRSTLLLAALLAFPACDGDTKDESKAPRKSDESSDEAQAQAATPEKAAEAEAKDPWREKLESRVLADSGLGVGGKLSAFQILNGESGEEYCQVCRFGSSPKLMAVGTAGDEAFKKDLKDLDAIVQKYADKGLKAFAVVTDIEGGKATTPSDTEAAKQKAKALKEELGLTIPVVVPAPEGGGPNKVWNEYYNITESRTVMFADGKNEVKWSGVGPEDWSELNTAIGEVVDG